MSGTARQGARLIAKNWLRAQAVAGLATHAGPQWAAWSGLGALAVAARHLVATPVGRPTSWPQQPQQRAAFSALPVQEAGEPAGKAPELQLTDSAVEKLQELTAGDGATRPLLRLTVEAGGCSGFSYRFDLEDAPHEGDRVFETRGVRLATDGVSLEFVRGAKVDYSQELIKAAFEVIDNPNADKGCGCGSSFSPK